MHKDLREWLEAVESRGELLKISGAEHDLEMSSIAEIVVRESKAPKPAILFDDIPGYPKGFRTLFGHFVSPLKIAMTLGLPEVQTDSMTLLRNWRKKARNMSLIPPKFVTAGSVLDNSLTGNEIDLFKFPSPRFHELDTHRYIGTAVINIQRDPDEGWVNLGIYRNMVVDKMTTAFHAVQQRHGSIIQQKYFTQGKVMPIALAFGEDPTLYWATSRRVPWGVSEYDYAGGIKGEPIEVIEGPYTGLPIPADAEIVIEGEVHPGEFVDEGPFGEWHGYYGNLGLKTVPEPVIRIKAIHYRNDPILACAQMAVPHMDGDLPAAIHSSELVWTQLEAIGIPGIKGVWCHEIGHGCLFNVISIKQLYAGHAQSVGIVASQYYGGGPARWTVVVDDDIDPTDLEQVIWAMLTRSAPHEQIQILKGCVSASHDPVIPLAVKEKYRITPKPLTTSRAVFNACQPFEHKENWYPVARVSPELRAKIIEKWQPTLAKFVRYP